ncbi:MAG: DivIVA domain-containing protein [Oscillibacter sp.]|nr:DivIVA domain-containing protein [Oscillibacter sp.]
MLTPQDVSGRSFTKMMMGGYNMTMVDEFLDELTDDYTTLYKENADLKAKLKVLAEKVEEYRATEDSMRATLLTAQRLAESIVKEAEAKRDEMLGKAEAAAREKLEEYRREAVRSDERLRQGQTELQRFIAASRDLCNQHLEFLEGLPGMLLEDLEVAEVPEEAAPAAPAPEAAAPAPPAPPPPAKPPAAEEASTPPAAEDLSATRRVNLNELKFGPNYRSEGK